MKKVLILAMVLTGIMFGSCTKDDSGGSGDSGSIYGIVTKFGAAEPMKAVGVELYKAGALLLKTVTFDDGHFEFKDLNPGNYQVKVMADGYDQIEDGYVIVEAGRQARIDLQVKYHNSTDYTIIGNLMIQTKDLGKFQRYVYDESYVHYSTRDDAENICKASRVAGYTDWRLPTIEELRTMYTEKETLNMALDYFYWSSSIAYIYYGAVTFYVFTFSSGEAMSAYDNARCYVRAVRTIK